MLRINFVPLEVLYQKKRKIQCLDKRGMSYRGGKTRFLEIRKKRQKVYFSKYPFLSTFHLSLDQIGSGERNYTLEMCGVDDFANI